jgi:hypothetical protein
MADYTSKDLVDTTLASCTTCPHRDPYHYEYRTFKVTGSAAEKHEQLEKLFREGWTVEPGITYAAYGTEPRTTEYFMMRPKRK